MHPKENLIVPGIGEFVLTGKIPRSCYRKPEVKLNIGCGNHCREGFINLNNGNCRALEAGNVDEALALAGKRQILAADIQKIDMQAEDRKPSGQSFDGCTGSRGGLPDTLRATVEKILFVDKDMMAPVQAEMSTISDKLNPIGKLKQYFDNPSIPQLLERDGLIA